MSFYFLLHSDNLAALSTEGLTVTDKQINRFTVIHLTLKQDLNNVAQLV